MAAFVLKSNISNVNLNKSEKKLFFYFNDANQTNTTKKDMILLYVVNMNGNLKKINEKKCCFKHV